MHLVSISIDPEEDSPARLSEYAKKLKAGTGWQFYTGTAQASIDVQKAFDAYHGDKMNHLPLIFLRTAPGNPWVRLNGFVSADDLIREYHSLIRPHAPYSLESLDKAIREDVNVSGRPMSPLMSRITR